ncbi:Leucine Rich Repeat [Seminavis robusta]|uniref:Leucine Rich Repeat n=1 Tax=Seminavis robusta TaxID=568900 RepID=A0A9N8ED15_9STRA|nr:Leucine Rich Repeat [Seminavis robusta]|eukprot:Sro997_g229400.1 Leucine Rich Repeat (1034) ;mRNA; r:10291-13392
MSDHRAGRSIFKRALDPSGPQPGAFPQAGAQVPVASVEALQEATPAQPNDNTGTTTNNNNNETEGWWKHVPLLRRMDRQDVYCGSLIFCLVVVSSVTILAVVLSLSKKDEDTQPTSLTTESPSQAPSNAPTMQPTTVLEGFVLSLLPSSTVQTIQSDDSNDAPQSKAFDFVLEDPSLLTFPHWRVLQRFALATFYHATGGDSWKNNSGWLQYEVDECQWFHHQGHGNATTAINPCPQIMNRRNHNNESDDGGAIEHLILRDKNLRGGLPPEIFLLTSLKSIDLDMNSIDDADERLLPSEIGLCTDLESVSLVHLNLQSLPTEIQHLSLLRDLNLSDNNYQSSFPFERLSAGSMTSLDLSQNRLDQAIPSSLWQLTALKSLAMHYNQMTGPLPTEIGLMAGLETLSLNDNQISSTIPIELAQLVSSGNLTSLQLENNLLSGMVPETLCPILSEEFVVDCYSNEFLCGCDCNCSGIEDIIFPRQTVATIREDPDSPQAHAFRHVKANPLLSTYPTWRVLQRFALATLYHATMGDGWRNTNGWLQYDVDECQWYQEDSAPCNERDNGAYRNLWLHDNKLRGTIPPELFLLTSLKSIKLGFEEDGNRALPLEIEKCTDLESVSLSGFGLSTLPSQVAGLTSIRHLSMENNNLEVVPNNLLSLGGHLTSLDLSHNLIHEFSSTLGKLSHLETLFMSSNSLRGTIPGHMASLVTGGNLTSLRLEKNALTGTVPEELCPALSLDCIGNGNGFLCGCDCVCTGIEASALPSATIRQVNEYGTAQSEALRWVKEDPSLSSYPPWRVLQRFALATVYVMTNGIHWENRSRWLSSSNECEWYQDHPIPCDDQGRFQHLSLRNNKLRRRVPRELFLMSSLRSIHMDFVGSAVNLVLPPEVGLCTGLQSLSFSGLELASIAEEITLLSSLRHLSLKECRLNRNKIRLVNELKTLKSLDLSHNRLEHFPSAIEAFTNLETLDLSHNLLVGSFPPNISLLAQRGVLRTLYLENNQLAGTVPAELCPLGPGNLTFDCNGLLCGCDCSCA